MGKIALKTIKLGDSADTSKNFLISVPTVPDGTLTIERENGTDVLTVDASGKVAIPGNVVPVFGAYRTTSQSVSNDVSTKVLFTGVEFDTTAAFSIANSRFQPQVAGYYQISTNLTLLATAGSSFTAYLYKNGTAAKALLNIRNPTGAPEAGGGNSTLIYLNGTTDYVEVFVSIAGTSPSVFGSANTSFCFFSGVLVRAA